MLPVSISICRSKHNISFTSIVTLITLFSYTLGCNVSSTWCLHTTLVSLTPKIQENSITNIKYAHDCVKTTHTPLWQSHFYYRVWHSPHHHSTKSVVKNTEVGPLPAEQITSQCTAAQKSCVFDHTNDSTTWMKTRAGYGRRTIVVVIRR